MVNSERGLRRMQEDYATPDWAKNIIALGLEKDPVKFANVLMTLANMFDERAGEILREAR